MGTTEFGKHCTPGQNGRNKKFNIYYVIKNDIATSAGISNEVYLRLTKN